MGLWERGGSVMKRVARHLYYTIQPMLPPLVDETIVMWIKLGYFPNIKHPRTFNEKIAHRKLFTRDERFAKLADKWSARNYVEHRIGKEYLTRVYALLRDETDIARLDFDSLPDAFVAKGIHDCGSAILVDDKRQVDLVDLREKLKSTLHRRYGRTQNEYWYQEISPGIIIEERLRDESYFVPLDFKFLVFHGKVKFIQVIHDRRSRVAQRFYHASWTPLSVKRPGSPLAPVIPRPKQLDKMIGVAETLAEGFDFVRIDLYAPNDSRIVFGEFTFAPAAGRSPFVPRSFDWELGEMW